MTKKGDGWIGFAGITLVIVGMLDVINGLWALDREGEIPELFYESNLETWGWIYLIGGIIVVLAGFAVLNRAQWARVVGIIVATISVVVNMLWVFAFPIQALILAFIGILVIYALTVYGGKEST
ncbi:MAG: hypothetical protein R6X23_13555 [Acidimicrobiia bacterium]